MTQSTRQLSPIDHLISQVSHGLATIFASPSKQRANPSHTINNTEELTEAERQHVAGLMRVNHVGEVCAQALYQAQSVTASDQSIKDKMQQASAEENDHLAWCEERLTELGARTSLLNPVWYVGAYAIGLAAGRAGDKWSLGFVAETEKQVVKHLKSHFAKLPQHDLKSKAIIEQMAQDEAEHAKTATDNGGASLPFPIKKLMQATAKVMTTTSYRV